MDEFRDFLLTPFFSSRYIHGYVFDGGLFFDSVEVAFCPRRNGRATSGEDVGTE